MTGGLYPAVPDEGPIVAGGAPIFLNPTPVLNPNQNPANAILTPNLNLSPTQFSDLQGIADVRNPQGNLIVPTTDGFMAIGNNYQLGFDPSTLQGIIKPALSPDSISGPDPYSNNYVSFTGADVRLMLELAEPSSDGRRYAKQLIESTTISVSIHREVSQVRASGYINPKGFALGKRTIAGTLVMTQFTVDTLYSFLQPSNVTDGSKDTFFTKIDQLPPFNITMIFSNEYGYVSQRRLLGVKFVTDGTIYSIQDMMTEQALSWMALDFTPLLPFSMDNLYSASNALDQTTKHELSPTDLMQQSSQMGGLDI